MPARIGVLLPVRRRQRQQPQWSAVTPPRLPPAAVLARGTAPPSPRRTN
ncbi:hypothetical protein STVIR_3465 [Streptomyces viridochromogenes Tue57]|uniref:Uncharacterized protein n=1 Tax=Streptomyces viridochromogenes Tue57 TaxID=1160705 RepID=L8PHN6_STRVR|nr:hypothetical protein STVIR_3465 [Streptomyces viridochromogenes Tue57]